MLSMHLLMCVAGHSLDHHNLQSHLQSWVTYILKEFGYLFRLANRFAELFKLVMGFLV